MKLLITEPFNLYHTLGCGQVFRWKKVNNWWYGVVGDNVIKIKKNGNQLVINSHREIKDSKFIERYFRFDDNLQVIFTKINKDKFIDEAIQKNKGLRIIRQDPWECLISYICATNANIPRIKGMIDKISRKYGQKITFDKQDFYTFPTPTILANTTVPELSKCNVGYRARYITETARKINTEKVDINKLRNQDYEKSKEILLSKTKGKKVLPGVGSKVADCVLLFSMEKTEAFPVDTWMLKAILEFYHNLFDPSFIALLKKKEKTSVTTNEYETISNVMQLYFGKYAGYAQEYLFHFIRSRR
ncbi:DNA repair protein [Candidatus Bathyarchaeota archaeon]|nr:DNA repair protein [Candidatus Bathyarchaeota archaeon]